MNTKHSLIGAFQFAISGCVSFFRSERNGKLQLLVASVTIALAVIASLSVIEWCIIFLCIAMVIGLEMINSAIERLCDIVHPEYNAVIKIVKDIAAGAVLWAAIISVVAGLLIFIPKFFL